MSEARRPVTVEWTSERTLRVRLGSSAAFVTTGRLRGALMALREAAIAGVVDLTPAASTIVVSVDPVGGDAEGIERAVRRCVEGDSDENGGAGRLVEIPVCYGGVHGPDLEECASVRGLSVEGFVAAHRGAAYEARFIGFMPGFAYLTGLPAGLDVGRLERPRVRVPAGSVGIAAGMCGIYPHESPGGWRLIGRTPMRMFDARRDPPALLGLGDRVRFVRVSPADFEAMSAERA